MPVKKIKLIECPRDAMQGWPRFIPTAEKAAYLNTLLRAGFDTLDFGSFVSHKAIPQMADTAEVLALLDTDNVQTRLLAIVANERGARDAAAFERITYLGYPFSISETFQKKNTNKTIVQSVELVQKMQSLCLKSGKELVIYISMGFGNPYGDPYDEKVVGQWTDRFVQMGIKIISLADTVGVATPATISHLFGHLVPAYPGVEFGVHFHSTPEKRMEKIKAAFENGCHRFDGAIQGFGGCPMAGDELVGNMATETLLSFFKKQNIPLSIDGSAFNEAVMQAKNIFI